MKAVSRRYCPLRTRTIDADSWMRRGWLRASTIPTCSTWPRRIRPGQPPFLVAEYVRGKSLRHVLHRCAEWGLPFPLGMALLVAREVLRGLSYLHTLEDQDLVHRDVTPASILCSYEGEVKLADFGLARWRDRLAQTLVGERWIPSPYQSPEQRRGLALDARSDLFAVGLILWELLTGRRAVEPGSTAVGASMLQPPSRAVPQLPHDIDDLRDDRAG